jgi:serine/threonine protein kinase
MPLDRDDPADPIRSLLPNAIRSGFETLAESDRERRILGGDPAGPRAEPIPVPAGLGRYRVVDEIGRGGVGVVYRAVDPETGRTLALKVLRPRHAASAEAIERFRTEARLCASLDHPGIVPVYEVGTFADGRPYYTMRLIAGSTLGAEIRTAPRHRLLAQFADVCEVIAHAHRRGIVHGDLKPSNVLIGGSGEVQVVDWSFTTALGPVPTDGYAAGAPPPPMPAPTSSLSARSSSTS